MSLMNKDVTKFLYNINKFEKILDHKQNYQFWHHKTYEMAHNSNPV